jgi:hypothetical protein
MWKTCSLVMVVLVLSVLATTACAQGPAKPGPEHELLKKLEGTWDATMKPADGGEAKGVMTYKMGLGGLWLLNHFKGDFGGMPFEGRGFDGYDTAKKKFVSVWIDSMITAPLLFEGTFDKDTKTMTMTGEGPGPEGAMVKMKSVTQWQDDNNITFAMSMQDKDGKSQEMFKIHYKRKS